MFFYTCHRDIPNNQWNVFEVVDGHEIYDRSFPTVEEAQGYCNQKNDEIATRAQKDLLAEILNAGPVKGGG